MVAMADSGGDRRIPDRFDHPAMWRPEPAGPGGRQAELVLLDRRAEKAAIDQVLGSVRDGFSGTLVLRGGPGVGKTALLEYAIDSAPDLQVSGAAGGGGGTIRDFRAPPPLLVPFLPPLPRLGPPRRRPPRLPFPPACPPPPPPLP